MIWYHNLVSVSETMNKKSKLKHRRKRRIPIRELNIDFDDIWEPIYLVLLATFVGMRFLLSTMFTIYWPEYFYRTLLVIGITLVMLHLMTVKDMQKKEIAAMAIVTFIFLMSHYVSGYDFLVDLLILILGAYRVDFEKILKTYMAVWAVLMAITIVGALTGAAENLVYHQGGNGERTRMALGICYPTDFAAYVAYMMFVFVCLRDKYITYIEIGAMAVLAGVVYWITDARTDFIVMALLIALVLFTKRKYNIIRLALKSRSIIKSIIFIPLAVSAIPWILTCLYNQKNVLWQKIDAILSGRLYMGNIAVNNYRLTPFGQYIQESGFGGSLYWPDNYFFIDCSYISIGLKYGVAFGSLIIILFMYFMKLECERKRVFWLIVLIIILIQSATEHHFVQYWYNPFLMFYLAENSKLYKKRKKYEEVVDLN